LHDLRHSSPGRGYPRLSANIVWGNCNNAKGKHPYAASRTQLTKAFQTFVSSPTCSKYIRRSFHPFIFRPCQQVDFKKNVQFSCTLRRVGQYLKILENTTPRLRRRRVLFSRLSSFRSCPTTHHSPSTNGRSPSMFSVTDLYPYPFYPPGKQIRLINRNSYIA